MVQLVAVSQDRHGAKKWQRHAGYSFAATDALAPIVGAEVGRIVLSMPVAFTEQSGSYSLVAVLSLVSGRNLFVGPDGRWLGSYVPACFRVYPFRLLKQKDTDQAVLCVDEASGLISDSTGEDFFDSAGAVSPSLKPVVEFMTQVERNRLVTFQAVSALGEAGVICPWQITVKTEKGEQAINGLHRIDEAAFNALPDDVFLGLRTASALPIVYAQILSTGQLGVFEHLARLHHQLSQPPAAALPETIDSLLERLNEDVIRF